MLAFKVKVDVETKFGADVVSTGNPNEGHAKVLTVPSELVAVPREFCANAW